MLNVKSMAVGDDYICMAREDEQLACWGGIFSIDEAKVNVFMFDAVHPVALNDAFCYTDPEHRLLCKSTTEDAHLRFDPIKASFFLPYMRVQHAKDFASTRISNETLALNKERACVIGLDQQIRCYAPFNHNQVTLKGSPPQKVNMDSKVADVLTGEHTTVVLTQEGRLHLLGLGAASSSHFLGGLFATSRSSI